MVRQRHSVLDFDFQANFPKPETGIAEISEVAGEKARMFGRAVREGTVHELQFDAENAARGSENNDPRENDEGREEPSGEQGPRGGRVGEHRDGLGEGWGQADQGPTPNEPQAHVAVEEEGLLFPVQETGETDGIFPSE